MECCAKLGIYFVSNLTKRYKAIVNNIAPYQPFFAFRDIFWSSRTWFRMWCIGFFITIYSIIDHLKGYIELCGDNNTFSTRKMGTNYLVMLLGAYLLTTHFLLS